MFNLAASLSLVVTLCCACQQTVGGGTATLPVQLQPLAPCVHRFDTPDGKGRNNYFFIPNPRQLDAPFRRRLRELVEAAEKSADTDDSAVHSIYVYRATHGIGAQFQGTPDALRGNHADQLVSFTRWSGGRLDMFYLIDKGQVIFDLIDDKPVSPAWEFK